MLNTLLGYVRALGIDAPLARDRGRCVVLRGHEARIHNGLYGGPGDGGELGRRERADYERVLGANAKSLAGRLARSDVLVLHDPQTAGLIPLLRERVERIV